MKPSREVNGNELSEFGHDVYDALTALADVEEHVSRALGQTKISHNFRRIPGSGVEVGEVFLDPDPDVSSRVGEALDAVEDLADKIRALDEAVAERWTLHSVGG